MIVALLLLLVPGAARAAVFEEPIGDGAAALGGGGLHLVLRRSGGQARLTDALSGATVQQRAVGAAPVVVTGTPGNDTLQVDFSGGDPAPGGIVYDGGADAGGHGDGLVLTGGEYANETVSFSPDVPGRGHAGTIALDADGRGGAPAEQVRFRDLEPLSLGGSASALVINLPADSHDNQAVLGDDPSAGNGMSELDSRDATFEATVFANPSTSLTINTGNDSTEGLFVGTLDSGFNAPIAVNGGNGSNGLTLDDNATLHGGQFDGGDGIDTIAYSGWSSGVSVNLGAIGGSLHADLAGDQETPPTASSATGSASITYNAGTRQFTIGLSVAGIALADLTGVHLHTAPVGQAGPITVDLMSGATILPAGTGFTLNKSGVALPPLSEAALVSGLSYVNVHSTALPGGEIRGQVLSQSSTTAATGPATGTGGVKNVEDATGGAGPDSLTGSNGVDGLSGAGGADTIAGHLGVDAIAGGPGDDLIAWRNGDGNDLIDGNNGTSDLVQAIGSTGTADAFDVAAGTGGRLSASGSNTGSFALDIGTAETLSLVGAGGDDSVTEEALAGVADLDTVRFFGLDGNDSATLANQATPAFEMTGGIGTDTVTGPDAADTWSISGPDMGNNDIGLAAFGQVEKLVGGSMADHFKFTAGSGSVDSIDGAGGTDSLDYSSLTDPVRVNLGTAAETLTTKPDGEQVVPPTTSQASSVNGSVDYQAAAGTIDVSLAADGIAPAQVTAIELRTGAIGENGPLAVNLGSSTAATSGGFSFNATGVALPPADEAALLGGLTYLVVDTAAFPSGEIRGQVAPGGVTAGNGVATGAPTVLNLEDVSGGPGPDSLVGSGLTNHLSGGGGADVLVGGGAADTIAGGPGDDAIGWHQGDGNDTVDGNADADVFQANGVPNAANVYMPMAGTAGRMLLQKAAPVSNFENVGSTESLVLGGGFAPDAFHARPLAGVTDLTSVGMFGMGGTDTLEETDATGVPVRAEGGVGNDLLIANGTGDDDTYAVKPGAAGRVDLERTSGAPVKLDGGSIEQLNMFGTGGADTFEVQPLAAIPISLTGGDGTDTLDFDGGCRSVTSDSGSVSVGGAQPVTHTTVENVNLASTFRFDPTSASVDETGGSAQLPITRTGTGSATVDASTSDGTALAGADYTATNSTLAFGAADTQMPFSVPVSTDLLADPDETFTASLTGAGPFAHVCEPSTATVTIHDVAPPPGGGPPVVGKLKILAVTTSGKDGSAMLSLDVPLVGDLSGVGKARIVTAAAKRKRRKTVTVASGKAHGGPGTVKLKLKPNRKGRGILARKGKLKISITVTLKPAAGAAQSATGAATLKLKKRKRR